MTEPLRFEGFELRPSERQLHIKGETAHIGARAFDLLVTLVDRRDRVVGKHELLDLVWPRLVVEEGNLQVHVHALRKLLGPGVITTVPGRGYRFTAQPVGSAASRQIDRRVAVPSPPSEGQSGSPDIESARPGNLPEYLPALYGREDAVRAVAGLLESERLVTISGAGGIGKTRLAQAVAHDLLTRYVNGVWMIELSWVQDETQLAAHVGQAMGLSISGTQFGLDEVVQALRARSLLLVLDNCEHLLDAVGAFVFRLMREAPSVRSLVTSQELLRVGGEQVYKLAPLAVPVDRDPQTALQYGAVRLFVERARALDRSFELNESNADAVVDICGTLDGIALAIELAAARVPMLGVFGVLDRLGERFRVLTGGSRVSLRRHQTLRAALDWSHNLLDADEKKVFRRLGVFSGGFFVEAVQHVARDSELDEWAVLDHLGALVDKSLVLVDGETRPRYRLLETSRAYAMERLAEAGETDTLLRRHAEAATMLCKDAVRLRDSDGIWADINNIRAACEWAIRAGGDDVIAVSLASLPAMVLAVRGMVAEALQRLLQVEPLVAAGDIPKPLSAQYWQWLGRIGIEGRLPTSRCIEALRRAESIYRDLGNGRHVHACLRMRAEALVSQVDLGGAADALRAAEALESAGWPVADRLRRLRVEGLLRAAGDLHQESLAAANAAYGMACAAGIERYELILLADMARVHLKMGQAARAVEQFRSLAEKARRSRSHGLTHAHALAGLTAALLMEPQIAEATAVAVQAISHLRRSGLLIVYCDLYAWLTACHGLRQVAAQLIGAADEFHRRSETTRDVVKLRARKEAMTLLRAEQASGSTQLWLSEGAASSDDAIADMIERAVSALPRELTSPVGSNVIDSP